MEGKSLKKGGMPFNLCYKSHLWDKEDEEMEQARPDEGKQRQEKFMGKVEGGYFLQESILDC